jgi:hypothetical protein
MNLEICVAPAVGAGNGYWALRRATQLGGKYLSLRFSAGVVVAGLFHRYMTASADRSIEYAEDGSLRESLPAMFFAWEMAKLTVLQVPRGSTVVTPQDLLATALVKQIGSEHVILDLPDAMGKIETFPKRYDVWPKKVWVWNREAWVRWVEVLGEKKVKLAKMPNLVTKSGSWTGEKIDLNAVVLKLSGSGGDKSVLDAIASNLPIKTFRGFDDNYKYLLHRMNGRRLITFPNEHVAILAQMAQKRIHPWVVFLYPRGRHEVDNLRWAIRHGLAHTICVSRHLQERVRALLGESVSGFYYKLVRPEELSAGDFRQIGLC